MTFDDTDTDETIAACARAGDHRAFDTLVRRHKDKMYRFIRRYVGHADDAYDVLQNCFVSTWSGLQHYDPGRPFLPWLRMIALNKCRDFDRRQTVRRLVQWTFARENSAESSTESVEQTRAKKVAESERLDRLDQAIAALPAFYKEPLLLTTVSGLSHQEVAQMLHTTPKAVEMRLYRARRKILSALGEEATEG